MKTKAIQCTSYQITCSVVRGWHELGCKYMQVILIKLMAFNIKIGIIL